MGFQAGFEGFWRFRAGEELRLCEFSLVKEIFGGIVPRKSEGIKGNLGLFLGILGGNEVSIWGEGGED